MKGSLAAGTGTVTPGHGRGNMATNGMRESVDTGMRNGVAAGIGSAMMAANIGAAPMDGNGAVSSIGDHKDCYRL